MDEDFGAIPELTSAVARGIHDGTGRLTTDLRALGRLPESRDAQIEPAAIWMASCFGACFPYWRFAQQNYMTHLSIEEHGKALSGVVSALMTHVGGGGVVPDAASSPGANPSARFVSMVLQSAVQVIEQLARGSEDSDHAAVHESYSNLKDAWLAVLRAEEDGSPPSDEESRVVSASLQHFIESYVSFGSAPPVYPASKPAGPTPSSSRAWRIGRRLRNAVRAFRQEP